MTEASQLWKVLKALCTTLNQEKAETRSIGLCLGLRILAHPALQPYCDNPLLPLGDEFLSLDALRAAILQQLEESAAAPDTGEIGAIWGSLYLPAEGRAAVLRLRAFVCAGEPQFLALRPLAPELLLSAQAALRAARAEAGRDDGLILFDIEAEGIDDALLGAVAGDSLGLPLALAFISALRSQPLPLDLGATGAIGRGIDSLASVGWMDKKREVLKERGIRLLAPPDITTLEQAWKSIRGAPEITGELVEPLTPLLGRRREAADLIELLSLPEVRLVTVTGPGGVGKTRLALHVASKLPTLFPDGVWTLSLLDPVTGGAMKERLAGLLGVAPGELSHFPANRRMLLLLDNAETQKSAAGEVGELLRLIPGLACLVTSRVALGVRGERRFDLEGLELSDGAALFSQRALESSANYKDDPALVKEIIRQLDGLPLAIELAASRIRMLSLSELSTRLGNALALLSSRSQDIPERQRTMRATLEWSVSILEPEERLLLQSLCVFENSFVAHSVDFLFKKDMLDSLARLEEASLLKIERSSGEPRFKLLMLVKEYSRELLNAEGDARYWESQHENYFLEQALSSWKIGNHDVKRYDEYEADIENFHAVFRRLAEGSSLFPADAVAAMTRFLRRRGRWSEMEDWLELIHRRPRKPVGAGDAARILLAHAALDRLHGELKRAMRRTDAALRLASRVGDDLLVADALAIRATLSARAGNIAQAQSELDSALLVYERFDDGLGQIAAQGNRGTVRWRAGQITEAARDFKAIFTLARQLGSRRDEAMAGINLAAACLSLDDITGTLQVAAASLEIVRDLPNQASAMRYLGEALRAGRSEAGLRCLEQARALGHRSRLGDESFREFASALTSESEIIEADWPLARLLDTDWLRPVLQELLAG